ncbi:MAG: protein-export chaperone SecB [Aminobacterium colombiense]|jgi:preprotein translocase subunit SecB|uniref:Preprotein translocase subunit SecB n=1 Tax=Aminobacterium colombiense (strain DSM 12261 / ALA-1) TaxID=572547 RepID=D5EET9_AMICL|nr:MULTISPECIES: protein-export chaperone SecB [Aminobacterium]MDD2378281.1 protein-export chaperone SecB [Aminobacterium colombiense]ADE57071.1 hypothetical protein Amico_0946 [Aminobacterium colombiense DSM 12261]MDD3768798.1 protein-export chaperone SecB [Aminobacterium colombiense]MDD4266494.1 protein-export chaperone SecB [Aminobacterium colombiense]MDD4585133.1 protein-export chaperone SecB [Aminobacterium colombiense]
MNIMNVPVPLEIDHYFFPEIVFKAFPPGKKKKKVVPDCNVNYSHTPLDNSGTFQVFLRVISNEDEKSEHYYYKFSIAAVGIFKWSNGFPPGEKERKAFEERLVITGLSILYSGVRNMLQTITGIGPYSPPYILKPISFVPGTEEGSLTPESPNE